MLSTTQEVIARTQGKYPKANLHQKVNGKDLKKKRSCHHNTHKNVQMKRICLTRSTMLRMDTTSALLLAGDLQAMLDETMIKTTSTRINNIVINLKNNNLHFDLTEH